MGKIPTVVGEFCPFRSTVHHLGGEYAPYYGISFVVATSYIVFHERITVMTEYSLRTKAVVFGVAITAVLGGGMVYINSVLEASKDRIIADNELLSDIAAEHLRIAVVDHVTDVFTQIAPSTTVVTTHQIKAMDSTLQETTDSILVHINGIEGGFYLSKFDEFLGYAFPTAHEPKPAYGPPPGEYTLIRDQVLETVRRRSPRITIVHSDPTIFTLATRPIVVRNTIVGASWTMIRLDDLLPSRRLNSVLDVIAIASLFGVVVAVYISWLLRKRVERINIGLNRLISDFDYRLPPQRGLLGSIARSINITSESRQRDQQKREELENLLRQRDKLAALGKLTAGVAHEVKTPLTTIKTRIQLWQRKVRSGPGELRAADVFTEDSVEMVIREVDRLSDLVKKLLVFSKPMVNNPKPTNIHQILEYALALVQPRLDEQHIGSETSFNGSIPLVVLDKGAMEQVFVNICMNAIEAMEQSGTLRIRTLLNQEKNQVEIIISDTGKGIPNDILENIFDPFFTTKEQGVGLGLSIVYEIIEAHKGTIAYVCDSAGTHCSITLPIAARL